MIRHVVVFSFKEGITESQRQAVLDELADLPTHYPAMQRFAIGENISRRDSTFTHAFSVEFPNEAELVSYLESERHETFIAERFRPRVAQRAIVSFEA